MPNCTNESYEEKGEPGAFSSPGFYTIKYRLLGFNEEQI